MLLQLCLALGQALGKTSSSDRLVGPARCGEGSAQRDQSATVPQPHGCGDRDSEGLRQIVGRAAKDDSRMPDGDLVVRVQRTVGDDAFAVDEGSVRRAQVPKHVLAGDPLDGGMDAGNGVVLDGQVVGVRPAQGQASRP